MASFAYAEVVLDGTLGFRGALEGPHYQIGAELGQQHGGNLFQSFSHFNINTGESATFSGLPSVHNIINRVTGGNPSRINGLIRSNIPNADMYFLNPYGIMFGEGANLDVQGSFHASTADTLRFSDGSEFNARYPNNSLLTIAPIKAFGFLTDAPAAITVQDTKLSVSEGKTLLLIGGDLQMDGELPVYDDELTFNTGLSAKFGRINLASVVSRGEVVVSNQFGLSLNTEAQGGLITINNTKVSTSGEGGGAVYIDGAEISSESIGYEESGSLGQGDAGDVVINVKNKLVMQDSFIKTSADKAEGGNIHITSPGYLALIDSGIFTSVFAEKGNGGNMTLTPEFIVLDHGGIIAQAYEGRGGNIDITTTGVYYNTPQGIYKSPFGTVINASSQLGIDGEVQINTPEIDVMEGLFTLPVDFLDASQLFKAGCTPRTIANTLLNKGHHQVALNNLLKNPWASFFLNKRRQDTEPVAESNLFDGNFSLTNHLFGCEHGE